MSSPARLDLGTLAALVLLVPSAGSAQEDPRYVEVAQLLASDGNFGDEFGEEVAIDGDTLVVGGDDIGDGAVYVFERNQGGSNSWQEVKRLEPPDGQDGFGENVAIDGDLLLVGAWQEDFSGAVFTYERNAGGARNWGVTGKLVAPDGIEPSRLFYEPAVQAERLLVGASQDDEGGGFGAGAVYVFERDEGLPSGWRALQKLIASDARAGAFFGDSLALDGHTIIGGAYSDDAIAENAGAAYVFELGPDGLWSEVAKLTAPDPQVDHSFGFGVAVEGDTVFVGNRGEFPGVVYIFGRDVGGEGQWGLAARIEPDDPDVATFGEAVDSDGGRILVGGPVGDPSGRAYLFEQNALGEWVETFRAVSEADSDRFGTAVAIDGGSLLVGASTNDDGGFNAGSAFVYQAVAHPRIALAGACPGEMTLEASGATPHGPVVVARSLAEGLTVVPAGPCAGAELGLDDARVLGSFVTDGEGGASFTRVVPESACGLFLQAVDRVTCGVGAFVRVPVGE